MGLGRMVRVERHADARELPVVPQQVSDAGSIEEGFLLLLRKICGSAVFELFVTSAPRGGEELVDLGGSKMLAASHATR